uniref:2-Cys peroxiredoxin BAS1, chloroplastic-like isoform X2 n=1 Tax=Scatophagus argus TaxID=75038 RepID=UPI001ED7CDC4|nr:2-Cys peroxiredoxin BAS1, chloroplastic-like isoform X2 [Scatophagus argus]
METPHRRTLRAAWTATDLSPTKTGALWKLRRRKARRYKLVFWKPCDSCNNQSQRDLNAPHFSSQSTNADLCSLHGADLTASHRSFRLSSSDHAVSRAAAAHTEHPRKVTLNMPGLLLGDFEAETTTGKIKLHEFLGDSWGILFSHPRDYTPVCTTELGRAARLSSEFSKRNVKMIALSIDCVEDHHGWIKDILAYNCEDSACCSLPFPIIADSNRELAVALGMLDPDEKDKDGFPLTARCPPPGATLMRFCEWWTLSRSQRQNEWPHLWTGSWGSV